MDTTHTRVISVEQLRRWLNRENGKIHGSMLINIDEILKLAISAKELENHK